MAFTTLDLSLAGGNKGFFTATGASGIVAGFTIGGSQGLAQVDKAYSLTAVDPAITLIDAGSALKGWTIDATNATSATVKGSDYNDSIKAGKGTVITGTGKDSINITALTGETTVTDYMYGSDVIVVSSVADPQKLISTAGEIVGTGSNKLKLNTTDGVYKATLTTNGAAANTVNVWMGSTTAQNMDGSAETKPLVMVAGTSSDTLIGGSKADSIYASAEGAYAFGGAGTDNIFVGDGTQEDTLRQYVAVAQDSGKDSVEFFTTGFADTADVLVLRDGTVDEIKLIADDANGHVKLGSGDMQLTGDKLNNAASLQLLIQDSSGTVSKVAGVADGGTYAAVNGVADYYISAGKTGKVDFSNATDDNVVVELSNAGNYEDNATFKGIDSVIGGKGNSTLIGDGEVKNYIAAAGGNTTLWGGGASNDTLVGDNNSIDAFFVGQGDGKDTISTFKTGVDAESDDVLYMLNSPVASLKNDDANTTFTFTDGSTAVFKGVKRAVDKGDAIRFSLDGNTIQTALVGKSTAGNNFQYSSDVDMFFGGSQTDTLKVDDTQYDGANVDIRLNNTLSQSYSSIEKVDASSYSGNAFLAGNDNVAEDLTGGKGKTTLWGGMGANDTLRGTTGDVTGFYFGKGNGEDVILTSDSDDKVVFYDFANTDLTAIDNTGSQLKFTFNDGSSLQIQNYTSASVQTFEMTNGTWTYDKSTKTFTQTK